MQLPHTSNNLIFWLDPSEKFVEKGTNNKVNAITNRSNGAIITPSFNFEPTWVDNVVQGKPVLRFAGGQNLVYNLPVNASTIGTRIPLVLTCVARPTTFDALGNTALIAGNQTAQLTTQMLQFGDVGFPAVIDTKQTNSGAGVTSPFTIRTDSNWHVYSSVYDGVNLLLRRDGRVLDLTSAVSLNNLTSSINQICVGDFTPTMVPVTGHAYYKGDIAMVIAYTSNKSDIDYSYEEYLMKEFNI